MANIIIEGTCCECCALVVANGDESGCRDYYGHTHRAPSITGRLERQADEIATELGVARPEGIDWSAWAVITGEESEVIVGPCDLCGEDGGYMMGFPFAIIR